MSPAASTTSDCGIAAKDALDDDRDRKQDGFSQSLVSYHLRALRQEGLVASEAAGRANIYRLAHPDLDKLAALMASLQSPTPSRARD